MTLRITTLTENTAGRVGLLAEWGLSILVETDDLTVLLDAGPGPSAAANADLMRVELGRVSKIVISHGHADHTGGLREILRRAGPVEVIAHPDIWAAKYGRTPGQRDRYTGIPFVRAELESLGASFNLSREPVWLSDRMVTTGEIPLTTEYEEVDTNLFVKDGAQFHPDELRDDRALVVKGTEGLVIILGCAHRGIINTLRHACQLTGESRVYAVIGGTHLFRASEERVLLTVAALQESGVQRVGVSHCTGLPAAMMLARELGDVFFFNNAGTRLDIE